MLIQFFGKQSQREARLDRFAFQCICYYPLNLHSMGKEKLKPFSYYPKSQKCLLERPKNPITRTKMPGKISVNQTSEPSRNELITSEVSVREKQRRSRVDRSGKKEARKAPVFTMKEKSALRSIHGLYALQAKVLLSG